MKRIGILGGTFNPPHIGHCIIANEVLHALSLDEVRLMPNAIPPHKQVNLQVSNEQRLEMVRLAIEGVPGLAVESFELDRGGISYTYETMLQMTKFHPDTEFYFIIGGDSVETLETWYRIDDLAKLVRFVGVNRPGSNAVSTYDVEMIEIPEINLSSSLIRTRLEAGKSVDFLVSKKVEQYIRGERLYGTRTGNTSSSETKNA